MSFVLALGFFDGVHLGHGALLSRTVQVAHANGWESAAMTFDRSPGKDGHLLTSVEDRVRLIRSLYGIDRVFVVPFTDEFRHESWSQFLDDLIEKYETKHVVCGWDYRFGFRGEGDADKLREYTAAHGVGCDVISKLRLNNITVSSTFLKTLVKAGDMAAARRYFGHPYTLSGVVQPGRHLGHTLGFPTANLIPIPELVLPAHGVYAVRGTVDGRSWNGVCNIGTRPTVNGRGVTVETWLDGFSGDLYGRTLAIDFYCYLRPEHKFASVEELKEEIFRNQKQAAAWFAAHGKGNSGYTILTDSQQRSVFE